MGQLAPGVTSPYGYVGGCAHFFDVHYEEFGQAAVNAQVVFDVHDRLPELSASPVDGVSGPAEATFWRLHHRGLQCDEIKGTGGNRGKGAPDRSDARVACTGRNGIRLQAVVRI